MYTKAWLLACKHFFIAKMAGFTVFALDQKDATTLDVLELELYLNTIRLKIKGELCSNCVWTLECGKIIGVTGVAASLEREEDIT